MKRTVKVIRLGTTVFVYWFIFYSRESISMPPPRVRTFFVFWKIFPFTRRIRCFCTFRVIGGAEHLRVSGCTSNRTDFQALRYPAAFVVYCAEGKEEKTRRRVNNFFPFFPLHRKTVPRNDVRGRNVVFYLNNRFFSFLRHHHHRHRYIIIAIIYSLRAEISRYLCRKKKKQKQKPTLAVVPN